MKMFKSKLNIAAFTTLIVAQAGAWDLKVGNDKAVSFHGFASQGFLSSTKYDYLTKSTDGSFQFTEVGLNASYSPFERTRIAVQGFAFDLGKVGNLEPFLDYASLEYSVNDYLGFRGGRVRRAGGIYNHIQDVDLARTFVLLPQGIYDARWRDFSTSLDGGTVFGNIPLGKAGSLSYEAFIGQPNISEDGGVARWIQDGTPGRVTSFEQPLYFGGQIWYNTPVRGLRAGAMVTQMDDFGFNVFIPVGSPGPFGPIGLQSHSKGDVFTQQYSLEYLWKSWTFQAEYYTYRFSGASTMTTYSGTTPIAVAPGGTTGVSPDAWYVSAAYRFNRWLETGVYYTEAYANRDQRNGSPSSSQKDLALALRFDPTDWWIFKIEGHYLSGTALLQDQANNPLPARSNDGWFMLALKTTFSF